MPLVQLPGGIRIACAFVSIFTLAATNISDAKIKLPLDLPEIYKTEFYPIAFVTITVLFIVYGSATSQAIRARQLINRFIYKPKNKISFDGNIYLQDIIDVILYPAINRVAPLAQVLQGKKQFFPEADNISNFRKNCALLYYLLLKLIATVIVYGLPGYALYVCFQSTNDRLVSLWSIPVFFFWVFSIFSLITLITLVVMDIKYTLNVIKRIRNNYKRSK